MKSGPGWLARFFSPEKPDDLPPQREVQKIYLVSRSQSEVPAGHRVDEFEASGLLDWFQKRWRDDSFIEAMEESGSSGFREVLSAMDERGNPPPKDWEELQDFLKNVSTEGEIKASEHAIESVTDNDEIDQAWYLFDQTFAEAHPDRVAYLLQRDWKLPEAAAEGDTLSAGASSIAS